MQVELLDRDMVDSDLGVVNAAKCSFDKESSWLEKHIDIECPNHNPQIGCNDDSHYVNRLIESDKKLIRYLAKHNHWTPFAHAQEVFALSIKEEDLLYFLMYANLAGFEWSNAFSPYFKIRGSLYAWLSNLLYLPDDIMLGILKHLQNKYPVSTEALRERIVEIQGGAKVSPIEAQGEPELKVYTLRISCPIAVKRQLETHRRNFVMTDIEDFSQNEVSRRYIATPPEFYYPKWRMQSASAKQGSSSEPVPELTEYLLRSNYTHLVEQSRAMYVNANASGIAHEQSRLFLPLSTYTTFWWTGSLKSWRRVIRLRLESHAQQEVQELAALIQAAIPTVGYTRTDTHEAS